MRCFSESQSVIFWVKISRLFYICLKVLNQVPIGSEDGLDHGKPDINNLEVRIDDLTVLDVLHSSHVRLVAQHVNTGYRFRQCKWLCRVVIQKKSRHQDHDRQRVDFRVRAVG